MLASADELQASTKDATVWFVANPCPDAKLGAYFAGMLNTCAEVALSAQCAVTDPRSDTEVIKERLSALLAVVEIQSRTLETW